MPWFHQDESGKFVCERKGERRELDINFTRPGECVTCEGCWRLCMLVLEDAPHEGPYIKHLFRPQRN